MKAIMLSSLLGAAAASAPIGSKPYVTCSTLEESPTDLYARVWNPRPGTTLAVGPDETEQWKKLGYEWKRFAYECVECPPHTYSNETTRRKKCNEWWFGDSNYETPESKESGIPGKSTYCGRGEAVYDDWAPHAKAWASLPKILAPYPMCEECGSGTKVRADRGGCEPLGCGRGTSRSTSISGSPGSVGTRTIIWYECP